LGPVVKINPDELPQLNNIHYLGSKTYKQLPEYVHGWQIAMIPFALNESTQFISPTKTPEYLAAGKPVISTAIKDIVTPYGKKGLVHVIKNAQEFIDKATVELADTNKEKWLQLVDNFLENNSWDKVYTGMLALIKGTMDFKHGFKKRRLTMFDFVIAGAGFAGSVLAERLASKAGKKVLIVEKEIISVAMPMIIIMKTVF